MPPCDYTFLFVYIASSTVSILVLVDAALRPGAIPESMILFVVSILVLVDAALRPRVWCCVVLLRH